MMETGHDEKKSRRASSDRLKRIPADLVAECRQISEEISDQQNTIRETKVIAAKIRIESDYYNSDNVLRIVASRLLDEAEAS
jgi:hypothetical protein